VKDENEIFISWSLPLSKEIALALKDWLEVVFTECRVFMSDADIDTGTVPMERIRRELDRSSRGIIVLTRENQSRPWINFEAGNLFASFETERSRVIPLLVDFDSPSDLPGPLGQLLQASLLSEVGMEEIARSLCHAFGLDLDLKHRIAERFLPDFWAACERARAQSDAGPAPRRIEDKVDEMLELVRFMTAEKTDYPRSEKLAAATEDLEYLERARREPDFSFVISAARSVSENSRVLFDGERWLVYLPERTSEEQKTELREQVLRVTDARLGIVEANLQRLEKLADTYSLLDSGGSSIDFPPKEDS
jgi:hypothetical protein